MSTIPENKPIGLALAVRTLGDSSIKVSTLLTAIRDGKLQAEDDQMGRKLVTLEAIRQMRDGATPQDESLEAEEPDDAPKGRKKRYRSKQ